MTASSVIQEAACLVFTLLKIKLDKKTSQTGSFWRMYEVIRRTVENFAVLLTSN